METNIAPDGIFKYWSPDTVAECMDGIDIDLYRRLWSLVKHVPTRQTTDETPDSEYSRNLAQIWHLLTREDQLHLNACAAAQNKAYWGE